MKRNQELLEKKKALERKIKTLKGELKDTEEELLQVEEELQSDGDVVDYERNIRDNAEEYESNGNTSEEKCETRKRKNESDERKTDKRRRTTDRIIEKLRNEMEEEESKDNVQHTDTESLAKQATEIINGYGILKGQETVLKLRWYNYAESFQMRIMEEMEGDLSISEQTARTRMYRRYRRLRSCQKKIIQDYER